MEHLELTEPRQRGSQAAARIFVGAVILGGLAVVAMGLNSVDGWGSDQLLAFVSMALATAVAEQFQIPLVHRRETQNFAVTDAVWTAGLLLAPTGVLPLGVAAGVVAGEALKRWSPRKVAFNAGQFVLGVSTAQLIYAGLGRDDPTRPAAWAAAVLAMAAFFVINTFAMGLVIALHEGKPISAVLSKPLGLDLLHWVGNVTLGILGAVVWQAEPLDILLLIVPVAMLYTAYRGWFRSMRQRDAMREMARAAEAISEQGDLAKRVPQAEVSDDAGVLAATLNRMLNRLDAAFRGERRFISEASHELRTPITICRGHLETLGPDPTAEEIREAVQVVVAELERMARIVDDLTMLARAGDLRTLRRERVAIEPLLADVGVAALPLLNGCLEIAPVPPGAAAHVDRQRLTQALLNLLQNAALHGQNGGRVLLRAVPLTEVWRFEVVDEGLGVSEREVESIFQPFSRGKTPAPGSGLGLAIVKSIVEAHGGAVGVDSRPGAGTTFWIEVPSQPPRTGMY